MVKSCFFRIPEIRKHAGIAGLAFWLFLSAIPASGQARLERRFLRLPAFEKPVGLVHTPALPSFWFVVEQRGLIYRIPRNVETPVRTRFLDLSQEVSQQGWETGLLGLAFHPEFAKTKKFYLSYTAGSEKKLVSRIVEMEVLDVQGLAINPAKTRTLLEVSQPYSNHNGGGLVFGPDGYLYFSWGDGGSARDPQNNSQRLETWFGKVFRIDVNKAENGKPYGIPPQNPFVGRKNAIPEIFAYGLRNVWQMQFDAETGKLWAGDVGQNDWEEIDTLAAGRNYGWRVFEGFHLQRPQEKAPDAVPPVWEYSQKNGDKSVTGGFVYRGNRHAALKGNYLYGDFMTGRIWAYRIDEKTNRLLVDKQDPLVQVSCFAASPEGEIFLCDYNEGWIYELTP